MQQDKDSKKMFTLDDAEKLYIEYEKCQSKYIVLNYDLISMKVKDLFKENDETEEMINAINEKLSNI